MNIFKQLDDLDRVEDERKIKKSYKDRTYGEMLELQAQLETTAGAERQIIFDKLAEIQAKYNQLFK